MFIIIIIIIMVIIIIHHVVTYCSSFSWATEHAFYHHDDKEGIFSAV